MRRQEHEPVAAEQAAAGRSSGSRSVSMRQAAAAAPPAVAVRRRIEDDAVVAPPATDLAGHEGARRRRRASGSAGRRGRCAPRCRAPRRPPDATHRRGRPRAPARARPASRGRCTRTGAARPAAPAGRPAAATRSVSQASIAACSGNSPTWPASVARSPSSRSSISTVHGIGRRPPRGSRPALARSKRRSASSQRTGIAGRSGPPAPGGRSRARRSARVEPRRPRR